MALKVANSTDTFSSATAWDSVTNAPTIHATTNLANVVLGRFTATFTAPNTTNASTGVLLYTTVLPTGTGLRVTLQENTIDTAATVAIAAASLSVGWNYFRFPTPYVFTTTVAGAYRFKVTAPSTTGTNAADSGGTLLSFIATDNRLGALASTDDIMIASHNNVTGPVITVAGSQLVGSGTNLQIASSTMSRAVDMAVSVSGTGARLQMDTSASATLTVKGHMYSMNAGEIRAGTTGSPYPSGKTATIKMDSPVNNQWGFTTQPNGVLSLVGATLSNWKSTYVSGAGTAASPMLTAGDIGSVGDQITIAATGAANQTEYRFIITKNSSTSYVLSLTSGGAEAALTNTHAAGAHIVNIQRNVVVQQTTSTFGYFFNSYTSVANSYTVNWARIETASAFVPASSANPIAPVSLDYTVIYNPRATGISWGNSKTTTSVTGMIIVNSTIASSIMLSIASNSNNKTFTDCYFLGAKRAGISIAAFNVTFTRCVIAGCNIDASTASAGATLGVGQIAMNDCDLYANGISAFILLGVTDTTFTNCRIGVLGNNGNLVATTTTDTYNTGVYSNCTIGDTTLLTNYLNMIPGSNIAFENVNGTAYNNTAYTVNGKSVATGSGLTDTTVRSGTSGEHSVRLDSETTDGRSLQFDIVATPNEAVLVTGYIWENATFVADGSASAIAELYLPGKVVGVDAPDATKTMTKTTSSSSTDAAFTLSAFYSGFTYDLATVRIRAITTTANASVYVGSINQGGNPATKFNIWRDGKPIDFMPEAIGDAQTIAAAVWNYQTSVLTVAGTTGKVQADTDLTNLITAANA